MKNLNRRAFTASLAGAGAMAVGLKAAAQGAPVEGTNYVKLGQPAPIIAPPGKIEVVEFFWYGCPHCNAFEPMLEAWVKKLPPDVLFRRVPVAFREIPFEAHQRIFYALEALGLVDTMQRKVFYEIHNERNRLDKPAEIAAFAAKNNIDSAKFMDLYNSFGVQTKAHQAKQLSEAYKIDGVPALGVHGRYYTSASLAGSQPRALAVTDYLVGLVRKG